MKRKLIALLLLCTVAMCIILSPVYAEDQPSTDLYLALGDSIARGYGLSNPETMSYPALFANENGLQLVNKAEDGMTATELLDNITSGKYAEELPEAKVITVSIGSNDLMDPLIDILAQKMEMDTTDIDQNGYSAIIDRINQVYDNGNGRSRLKKMFKDATIATTDNAALNAAADKFADEILPSIVSEIRKVNPDAQLIFTSIYNPYKNVTVNMHLIEGDDLLSGYVDLGDICQNYVNRVNKGFASPEGFVCADVAPVFNEQVLTNATRNIWVDSPNKGSLDPHPNASGHIAIQKAVSDVYVKPQAEVMYGDIDKNNKLEAADAAIILQYVLKKTAFDFTPEDLDICEVTGDNEITAADAAAVLQKVLKSTYTYPRFAN